MGNQQMTYSSNPLDGTYGDSRLLYQTDNFGRTTEVCDDDSATVVHDILDEIIDSVCHRDDSISDQTRLPPDKDQAPFNPYLFPDQNTGAENSTSNLRNVGYLEREDSDAVNIRNILENSKYEPFKNSNEDVFVDSLEGQYENFTKIECGTYKNVMLDVEPSSEEVFTAVCSERKDSDCLDQKYFQNKENLTSDDEKLESISYHYKEMPVKTAEEDPSPEINEDAKAINENCINKLPLEVSCCSFLQENLQMSEVIQGQLHFSTDFNSNIESHVRNLCNIEEVNEIRSGDDDDNTKNGIFPCSNDEGNELLPKNSVNEQFSDLQVKSSNLKILEQNKEECLPVINSARSQNSSTVEEFANIVKEICSTIEESKPITDEFYYCDSLDDIKESCDKIEKSAPVHENVGSKLEGSTVLNKQMTPDIPRFSDIPSSQEENTTIEQIKTILQDICSSVEETSSNFKQSSSTFQDSLLSKEKCVNDFNKLPSNEKEPIFAEICSTIEEVSSTLKEKCPYIEENERDVKKEIWCASKESYITDDKRVTEEKESAEAEIDAKSFVMDGKCSDSQAISIIDPEQLSKKEMVQEIPHKPSDIHQSNLKEKTTNSFIENLSSKEELATANTSPMHKDTLCSLVEDSYEKSYDKLDSNNKESSSSSTVEEMLSLFKEICSSVDNKVFPEETRIEDSNRENLEKSSKDESMIASLAAESSLEKSSKNETRIMPLALDSPLEKFSKNETRITPLAVESPLEKSSKNETRTTPLAAESSLKKSSKNETRITPLAVDSSLEKSSKNETRTTPLAAESSLEKSSKNETRITPLAVDSPLEKSSKNETRITPLAVDSPLEKSSKNETRITPLAVDSSLEKSSKNETRTTPLAAESSLEKSSKNETRITPLAVDSPLEKSSKNETRTTPLAAESSLEKSSKNETRITPLAVDSPLEKSSKNETRITPLAVDSSLEKSSKNETRTTPLAAESSLEKSSKNETRITPLAVDSPLEKSSKNETRTTPLAAESSLEKSSKNETRIIPLAVDSPLEKSSKNETRTTPLATESSLEKSSKNETRITPLAVDSPLEKSSKNETRTTPLATESSLEKSSKNETRIIPLAVDSPLEKSSKNETRITPLAVDSPLEKSSKNETRTTPLAAESSLEKSSKSETRITPLAVESLEKSSENKNIIAPLTESSLKKRSENQNRIIPLATESSSLIEEIKSIPTFSPSFEENSEALEHSKPTLEEDISTMDETFQLAPELPLEEISKTTDVHKVETTVVKSEESSIKICEDQSIKSIGADKTAGVFTDSQNIKECQETSSDEFSRGSDNSKDKSLYEGSHICDLDDVISQFRHKHSQESKGSNSQITRTTKFQDSLSTKNKNRLVNNKKLKKLPNSCNNENSNVPLTWSSQTNGENIVEEKVTKKMEEENTKLVEKTEVVNTKESNLQQQSIQECEVTESKKDQENVNNKQLATIKLEENKENNAFCHWSKEKQELSFQIKNLNQTQKITRFIVKELINLISRWMEENHKENSELKETKLKLICERDQAIEDLRSVENAFSDLHRRYEKSKTIVEEYKENENRLKQQLAESALKLKQQKEMYKLLKKRSEERLEEANAEIINVQKSQETEIAVLKAQLRKAEMKANSLEKNLEQKIRENTELSSICEDLIAKVGRN